MKFYIFTLTILINYNLLSQISDITRFQNQNKTKECRESTPVVISENEILLFYCSGNLYDLNYLDNTIDTIYYSKSSNGGKSWGAPIFIIELGKLITDNTQGWYLTSLKTLSGRIILVWSDLYNRKINFMHSDDNGQTWSDSSSVKSISPSYNCNLSEIDSGRIWFSYNSFPGLQAKYLESTNNGETWSQDPVTFHSSFPAMKNLSFVKLTSKLLAFFDYGNTGIYYKESTDNGLSWSAEFPVVDSVEKEFNAKAIKFSDEELWIVYLVGDEPQNQIPNDIYYVQSLMLEKPGPIL